jgi:hypothetical protein
LLVDKAGDTMGKVVESINRVTSIMVEISASSTEQAAGVAQVGEAVTHMDNATQQNAALVEQMAAAASGLKSQAQELVEVVSTFKLSDHDAKAEYRMASPAPAATYSPPSRPATLPKSPGKAAMGWQPKAIAAPRKAAPPKPAAPGKGSGADDDWETF